MHQVLGRFRNSAGQFEKDGEIVATDDSVPIRIDFEPPFQAVHRQGRRVDGIGVIANSAEILNGEDTAGIRRDNFALEVGRDVVERKRAQRAALGSVNGR